MLFPFSYATMAGDDIKASRSSARVIGDSIRLVNYVLFMHMDRTRIDTTLLLSGLVTGAAVISHHDNRGSITVKSSATHCEGLPTLPTQTTWTT